MTPKGADFLLWHCQEPKNRPQFAQYPLPPAVCSPQLSQELSPTPGDPVPAWGLLGHPPSAAGWHKPPALAPAGVNVRLASSSPVPAGPPRHFLQAGPPPFFFWPPPRDTQIIATSCLPAQRGCSMEIKCKILVLSHFSPSFRLWGLGLGSPLCSKGISAKGSFPCVFSHFPGIHFSCFFCTRPTFKNPL